MNTLLKRSDMARVSYRITQFYFPLTRELYLPLLPSLPQSITALWLVLIAPAPTPP